MLIESRFSDPASLTELVSSDLQASKRKENSLKVLSTPKQEKFPG